MNYFQKKKLAFMSIVNRVKGFIRTITGALPLTLEGCVDEESIIDYTLYGQSVQNGTPTPETPVEVESVGEKTANLFNINDIESYSPINRNCNIEKVDGNFVIKRTSNSSALGVGFHYSFKAGNYALKVDYLSTNYTPNSSYIMHFADKSICVNASSVGYRNTVKKLNIPEDMTVEINIYCNDDKVVGNECTISIMLSEGYNDIPYEPYGYKIPIKVSGKNLFDENDVIASVDNWYYIGGSYSYGLNLEVGKRYRFSCVVINNPGAFSAAICRKPKIAGWSFTTLYSIVGKSSTTGKKSYTFVADGTECLWLYCDGCSELDLYKEFITENIKNFQLEEGATATDYEPYHEPVTTNIYLDEPLRKVGDYADYIKSVDLVNGTGVVVRNVKEIRLKTAKTVYTWIGKKGVNFNVLLDGAHDRSKGLCNREKRFTANGDEVTTIWLGVNTRNVYWIGILDYLGLTTVTEMNEWLTNNPTYVFYGTDLPTETPITLPPIPTFKGTSIISADTTTQPSNAEIEYYSNVKE